MLTHVPVGRSLARSLVAAAVCAAPGALAAQAAPAAAAPEAWQPWIGCWVADAADPAFALDSAAARRVTCVLPTARATAAEVRRYEGAREVRRDTIDASGERRAIAREGCRGWDQASFSADQQRVFLHSEYTCGPVTRVARGVLAITGGGEWLDVRSVSAAGAPPTVQVAQYRAAPSSASAPAELTALTGRMGLALDAARRAAAAPLTPEDVAEAVRRTDATTAASWVAATGQRFALDARRLRALKAAGVPGEVTDMMIAVSNPRRFAISAGDALGTQPSAERAARTYAERQGRPAGPTVWAVRPGLGYYDPFWGSAFGYSPYGYNAYGYNAYGYRPGYGFIPGVYPGGIFVGGAPVAIVRPPAPRVQLTRGSGYTWDGDASGGRTARPRDPSPSPSASQGGLSRSGGSSGGASAGSGSSGGSEGGRTAKPRP